MAVQKILEHSSSEAAIKSRVALPSSINIGRENGLQTYIEVVQYLLNRFPTDDSNAGLDNGLRGMKQGTLTLQVIT